MANESESNPKSGRNVIQEMTELAGRASESFLDAYGSLDEIERLCIFDVLSKLDADHQWALGEYGVVKTIAVLQAVVREFIRDVVNYRESKGETLPELNKAKISLEMLRLLKNETFSLGQFASHTIDLNSFADIEASFRNYCGTSLLNATKEAYTMTSPKEVYDLVRDSVQALFKKRHIICHENADVNAIEEGLLRIGIISVRIITGTLRRYRELNLKDESSNLKPTLSSHSER